jgi:hypothetical protein
MFAGLAGLRTPNSTLVVHQYTVVQLYDIIGVISGRFRRRRGAADLPRVANLQFGRTQHLVPLK